MPDQELTVGKIQTEEGVLVLNNMLRDLFHAGRPCIFQYGDDTAAAASKYMKGTNGVTMTSAIGYRMPKDGSVVAHSCLLNVTTATSGTLKLEVRINNTKQDDLELTFDSTDGTGVDSKSVTADRHVASFSKGDVIQMYATESDTMEWATVQGFIEVIFDDEN